jgi:hypothetical protein
VKYELGLYTAEDAILHIHRRENLKSYTSFFGSELNTNKSVAIRIKGAIFATNLP